MKLRELRVSGLVYVLQKRGLEIERPSILTLGVVDNTVDVGAIVRWLADGRLVAASR